MFNFATPKQLADAGTLCMNRRNLSYIGKYNSRSLYPTVDNKLLTKELAIKEGLAVPTLLAVVKAQYEVKRIFKFLQEHEEFAIKPAKGSGGKGILIIVGKDEDGYIKPSGGRVNQEDIVRHISNILAGLFSLGGSNDIAIIESLIQFDPIFDGYSYEGVPDIRLIIFKGYPVMAMLRLATHESDGKANLHQGAVGVGIGIADGKAVHAVQFDRPVEIHPDTRNSLNELSIPNWRSLLMLASKSYEMTGLGYLGADLVLDQQKGPLLLELNARPGLAIQIANQAGLVPRLRLIESLPNQVQTPEQRVDYAIEQFATP